MNELRSNIADKLRALIFDIVTGDFRKIESSGQMGRLTSEDLLRIISEYPGTLTMPSESAVNSFRLYPIKDSHPPQYFLELELWFDGAESDLTLSGLVSNTDDHNVNIEINDIRVM
jgi:hypothetical protein